MSQVSAVDKAKSFLHIAPQFQLGHLMTEDFHPKTIHLSSLANSNLNEALNLLKEVDRDALLKLKGRSNTLWGLYEAITSTLNAGNKIFMCGCGATGRLSLVLETLFYQKFGPSEQIVSFMAGGDFALIKSVESFEDNSDFGKKQLLELGFGKNDLLLASSEGGETPFVIGAVIEASNISSREPFFLYCNNDEVLKSIERSKKVIENVKIQKVNLSVGPMAISGSTRMQASTVLMLGIGVSLLYQHQNQESFFNFFDNLIDELTELDYQFLATFIEKEAKTYQQGGFLNYLTDKYLGVSILTDTTERSPTFSLRGFENRLDPETSRSLAYLFIKNSDSSSDAWSELLWRKPRPLSWPELMGKVNLERVLGFDISDNGYRDRVKILKTYDFHIYFESEIIYFKFGGLEKQIPAKTDPLVNHLKLKMLLNAHSTLIMGILGRYEGNVMTWVRPSNNKLIDRSARYIMQILKQRNINATYEDVVMKIFEQIEGLQENEPIVMKVVDLF